MTSSAPSANSNVTSITRDDDPRLLAFRTPPHNVEAEKALLGAVFANNRAYEAVSEFLRPEHFALGQNGRIFEACSMLIERGQIADPVTLKNFFEQDQSLAEIGGLFYLKELAGSAVGVINAGEYGRLTYDLYIKRELINLGHELVEHAYSADTEMTSGRAIEDLEAGLTSLITATAPGADVTSLDRAIDPALQEIEAAYRRDGDLAGLSTGLADVDRVLGGLAPGDLTILAGATSMGKTAMALGIAEHNAARHHKTGGQEGGMVAFFSLEMSRNQLVNRLLSRRTGIGVHELRRGDIGVAQWTPLTEAAGQLSPLPMFIDDRPGLTMAQIRSRARRIKRKHGLGLVVVDYLQLVQPENRYRGNRVNEVGEISRGMKELAKDLEIPVIALSQLSREVDRRENKRPVRADLRESGSLEQDADAIVLLHRDEYWLEQTKPTQGATETDEKHLDALARWEARLERARGKAEVIVAKNRHGPTGSVEVHFNPVRTFFADLDRVGALP